MILLLIKKDWLKKMYKYETQYVVIIIRVLKVYTEIIYNVSKKSHGEKYNTSNNILIQYIA